jgi:septal ring-binding cell division protein DamX
MKMGSTIMVALMLIVGIFLSYMLPEEAVINQPVFAQLGIPSEKIVINKTNITSEIAPTISENTTISAPEVNDTLIGGATPTTSNSTLGRDEVNNKTGQGEPLGGVK